jgi:pimeloyl-ACP methyl ester carboxylesterase
VPEEMLRKRTGLHVASDTGPRDGPTVVMVHGIASSPATFAPVVADLPGYRVVTLELLGFGGSTAPSTARYTIDEHAAALDAAVERLKLHAFVLVGHSLGALAASRFAAGHPRGLTAVVLVSAPVYVPASSLPDGPARTAMGLYLRSFDYLRANKGFTMRLAACVSRLLPNSALLDVNDRNWTAFALSLRNAVESQTSVADIASIRVPVEIVYGTLDPFVVPEVISLLGALRQVRITRVPRSTHVIGRTLAAAVAEAIARGVVARPAR